MTEMGSGVVSTLYQRIAGAWSRIGSMGLWIAVSLVLLGIVALLNPVKLGVYGWLVCKLSMAAGLGYAFDVSSFPDASPAKLEGIERAMAQTRRGTIIAATLISTGLMP
jgi:cobalamin synthase